MCGICGIVNFDGQPVVQKRIEAMAHALLHRGPDDVGFYFSPEDGNRSPKIGLGFRRLSIIDLESGHQPMQFEKWIIVFNGEIYNYRELKKECEVKGHKFLTTSDTEVLLHLYSIHGEKCLEKLRGMFAFAIWDSEKKEIFCARDPLGIKPFYYCHDEKKFIFSSETRSLIQSEAIPLEFDPISVLDFVRYRFVPSPHTVLKKMQKLPPAHCLKIEEGKLSVHRYWSAKKCESLSLSEADLQNELLSKLEESVTMQMVSDVPLGAFLSGGVDSSLIVALMAKKNPGQIETFSIGFEKGTGVDESHCAREVAQKLNTKHHEYILTEKDLDCAAETLSHMTEPVADPTVLPTAILSKFARQHVKVVLTGEGGDELFAGYNRYKSALLCDWAKKIPQPFQDILNPFFHRAGSGEVFRKIPNVTSQNWFPLNQDFKRDALKTILRHHPDPFSDSSYIPEHPYFSNPDVGNGLSSILSLERETALADRLLMKVDMASMGQSLEARPPYLDHTLVDYVSNIPSKYLIRHFKGKYILRQIASRFLPPEIAWRRKHGFIVPIAHWIGRSLKNSKENLLEWDSAQMEKVFNIQSLLTLRDKIYKNEAAEEEISLLWPAIVLNAWTQSLKKS